MKKVLRNSIDKELQTEFKRFLDHACMIFQVLNLTMKIAPELSFDDTDSDSDGY